MKRALTSVIPNSLLARGSGSRTAVLSLACKGGITALSRVNAVPVCLCLSCTLTTTSALNAASDL